MTDEPPAHLTDWKGRDWTPTGLDADGNTLESAGEPPATRTRGSAHRSPSARSSPTSTSEPVGVPISAILFGGRRKTTVPLVTQSRDWQHGVFMGATLSSETTAAATGAVGVVRRDPMAMLPFIGYNAGDYFAHWIDVGKGADATKLPKIFYVNWFRRDDDGGFLWPGFGENSRVLKWVIERLEGSVGSRRDRRSARSRRAGIAGHRRPGHDRAIRSRRARGRPRGMEGRDPADRGVVRQDRRHRAHFVAGRAGFAQAPARLQPLISTT